MAEPLHEAGEPPCVEMFGVLLATTPVTEPTPAMFQGFENTSHQVAVAQLQPWSAAASARAFAACAVAVAQPTLTPAVPQAAMPRALGHLADGGRLVGR